MEAIRLSTLDLLIVVVYLVGTTSLGLWASRGVRSSKDFFLAGRSLPWWAAGMSLVVSDIGAKDMVGLAGDAYRFGIVMMNFDFVGCAFPLLVAAFLFMPFLWSAGVYTIPEYLGRRYNVTVRTFFAVVWSLFMMGTIATILVSAAAMFEGLLGWSFWVSVGITCLAVGVYTASGGLRAVVVTDVVSCVVLLVGAGVICLSGLQEVGGIGEMVDRVSGLAWTKDHFDLLPPTTHPAYPWPAVVLGLGFVLGPAYWVGNQAIVQRTLGVRSQRDAPRVVHTLRGHQALLSVSPGASRPPRAGSLFGRAGQANGFVGRESRSPLDGGTAGARWGSRVAHGSVHRRGHGQLGFLHQLCRDAARDGSTGRSSIRQRPMRARWSLAASWSSCFSRVELC